MKKLILLLIVLPILLFAAANQIVDSTAWSRVDSFPISAYWLRQQGWDYLSLSIEIDIDSAGTTMIWNPISTGKFNSFSLDIPAKAQKLKIEYFPGIELTDITDYPYRWTEIDTIDTGADSTYRYAIFNDVPFFLYGWLRFIDVDSVDRTGVPVRVSGKEQ